MRKIGYSVGLEHTLERLHDLEKLYLSSGDVTLPTWRELVGSDRGWKLRTDNIADVFFALRFIHRTSGDVLVLENLDAIAISASLLEDEEQRRVARSVVFLWSVLVNDGEIFVNLLLSGFDEKHIRENLSAMIPYKRKVLAKAIPGRDATRRIARVVAIERQEKNKGSAGAGRSVVSLKRTEPLHRDRSLDSESSIRKAVEFSEDYFRKVPPRRKEWARTLGLWSKHDGLTERGRKFANSLRSSGYVGDDGFFIFWPMDYELVRSGFKPNLLPGTKTMWQALVDFANAYTGVHVEPFNQADTDVLVDRLAGMIKIYRSLHTRKSVLRRELAITAAYPAYVASAVGRKEPLIDVPVALAAEQNGEQRRVNFRRSRNTGGTLNMKR